MMKRKELIIGVACLAVLALVCTSTVPSVQAAASAAGTYEREAKIAQQCKMNIQLLSFVHHTFELQALDLDTCVAALSL